MNSLPGTSSPQYKGSLVHRGRVTDRVPEHGLFWIMDDLTGGRRLLDMADLEIYRPHNGGLTSGHLSGGPAAG
jgi:hypothetical protein